ncbi:MAG: plasmid mobilization protein [Thermoanaerobaculia bacterium]
MASGSDKRQRNRRGYIRCNDDEFNRIAAKADNAGLGFGAFMRAAALGSPGPRAQRRPPADHKALRQILGQVGRVGNNINQIARALNVGDEPTLPEVQEALRACREIRNAILVALGKNPAPGGP